MNNMVKLILLSADGIGAGKTSLASKLGTPISLASSMRKDLANQYPAINWNNLTQDFKSTPLDILGGKTPRDILIEYGQSRKKLFGTAYWCRRLDEYIHSLYKNDTYVIDDVRMVFERHYFKGKFRDCTHIHIVNPNAIKEPQFENAQLKDLSDYQIVWRAV